MLDGRGNESIEVGAPEDVTFEKVITHGTNKDKQYSLVWSRDDDVAAFTGRANACGETATVV
eukprot:SAG11_NODE_386_length_9887_cov_3.904986_5_plen_62_part_00